jgi:DNA-binding protein HU-beta
VKKKNLEKSIIQLTSQRYPCMGNVSHSGVLEGASIKPKKGEEVSMTKAELVDKMAKDANISKAAAGAALNSFVSSVTKALKKKEGKVTLVGFGTFLKVRRKARKGRNPQTGAAIKIKASNTVRFKPGKALKDAL